MTAKKLTDKQELFCQEYLVDLNATQAAIRAGYSEQTANEQGCQNLAKLNVQERVAELKQQRSEKVEITSDQVLRELKNWWEYDATQFMELTLSEVKKLPEDVRRLVTGFKTREDSKGNKTYELSFVSKEKTIEMINRHIGFYEKDNKQRDGGVTIVQLPGNER